MLFLLALRNRAEAQGGMAAFYRKGEVKQGELYRMLLKKGNPEINSFFIPLGTPYHTKESQQML